MAEAKQRGEFKYILPSGIGVNSTIESYTYTNSQGITFTYVGVNSTEGVHSTIDGDALIGNAGKMVDGKFIPTAISAKITNSDMQFVMQASLDTRLSPPFDSQKVAAKTAVVSGQSLFNPGASKITGTNGKQYSFAYYIAYGDGLNLLDGKLLKSDDPKAIEKFSFSGADLNNLATKDGRIAVPKK